MKKPILLYYDRSDTAGFRNLLDVAQEFCE